MVKKYESLIVRYALHGGTAPVILDSQLKKDRVS